MGQRSGTVALRLSAWFVVLLVWCGATYGGLIDRRFLPSPGDLAVHLYSLAQNGYTGTPLWKHIGMSVFRALSGFGLAVALGVPLGLLMGYYRWLGDSLGYVLSFLRPIPPIAYIPLAALYLGIGETSKIVLIFVAVLLFVVLNAQAGVTGVRQVLIRAGDNIGLSRPQLFRYVILPGALPSIMTGLRTGLAIAWALVVAAELIAAQEGLGYMVQDAANFFHLDTVFAGIVLIGIFGFALDTLLFLVQRRLLHWQGRA